MPTVYTQSFVCSSYLILPENLGSPGLSPLAETVNDPVASIFPYPFSTRTLLWHHESQ